MDAPIMTFPWKGIIIHHSLTRDSGTVSWDAIRRYHTDTMGWRDIGYHAGIEIADNDYELFVGRPLDMHGSHTRGLNLDTLGFCFVGNYDHVAPSIEMMRVAALRVLRPWMKLFGIPSAMVEPHRNYADKTCPGTMFSVGRLVEVIDSLPEADIK